MIKLKTNCDECNHNVVCKHIDTAKNNMEKLKKTQYGSGPNDDYDWDTMMEQYDVNIEFSCKNYQMRSRFA